VTSWETITACGHLSSMYYLTYYYDREIVSNKVTYFTQSPRWLFCASSAPFTSLFSRELITREMLDLWFSQQSLWRYKSSEKMEAAGSVELSVPITRLRRTVHTYCQAPSKCPYLLPGSVELSVRIARLRRSVRTYCQPVRRKVPADLNLRKEKYQKVSWAVYHPKADLLL